MSQPYKPTERRPLASRNLAIFKWTASAPARRGASPNAISVAGLVAAILGGAAFAATSWRDDEWQRLLWLAAALGIQLRLLANMLDGMVAIESGKASPVGELYNEIPDRLSDSAVLIGAGLAVGGDLVLGFAAALVAVFTAYVRAMGKAAGAPQDFSGPMAKPQRMAVMTAVAVYHAVTPRDWQPLVGDPPRWGLVSAGLALIVLGGLLTAARRLINTANHLMRPK